MCKKLWWWNKSKHNRKGVFGKCGNSASKIRDMKKKVYLYGLRFLANLILLSASISVSQCCMGTSYQISIDNQLKQKIKESR